MIPIKKIANLRKLFFNDNLPIYLVFLVTAQCNARCKMCFYWKNIENYNRGDELTLKEIDKFSKHLKYLQQVTLGGGEPFLRIDIAEICKIFFINNDVQQITIPTNALLPDIIGDRVKEMLENCKNTFFRISISLDGLEEMHDEIRGIKGGFKKALKTYHNLHKLRKRSNNLGIDVTSVISSYNHEELKALIIFLKKELQIDNHNLIFVRGDTRRKVAKNVSIKKYMELVEYNLKFEQIREKRPFSRLLRSMFYNLNLILKQTVDETRQIIPCVAGKKMLSIDEQGNIRPCELLDMRMGNLRENNYDIKKILENNKAIMINKFIKNKKCHCTWECALFASLIYHPPSYIKILKHMFSVRQ